MTSKPVHGSGAAMECPTAGHRAPPRARSPILLLAAAVSFPLLAGPTVGVAAGRSAAEASYLRALSRKFYAVWVQTVLSRVEQELGPRDPFNQPDRQVVLRLRFSPRGVIRSALVMRSSGHRPFDATARSAVLGTYKLPVPPASLRSDDGDVYLDWTFKRRRPWCSDSLARVVRVPFTESVLASGHYDRAIRMFQAATRRGHFSRYARGFGEQLLRLATRTQGSRVARDLLLFLDRPTPIEVLRTVFRNAGVLSSEQLRSASLHLATQTGAAAEKLLAALVTMSLPGKPRLAAIYLEALAHRPSAARHCLPRVRTALRSPDPLLSAPAARILSVAGTPRQRNEGLAHLRALLRAQASRPRLAALHQIRPPLALEGDLLDAVQRLTRYPLPTPPVRERLGRMLARYPTEAARRMLLTLTYTRATALSLTALRSLLKTGVGPAGCYRFLSLLKHRRSPTAIRRAAAAGLARHCVSMLFGSLRRLVRRGPTSARLGIASQIPLTLPRARKLIARLARDPSLRVRAALLLRLRTRSGGGLRSILRRWRRRHPRDLQALGCRPPLPPSALTACFRQAKGPATLRLAIRLARRSPAAVASWALRLLHARDWSSRLRAARVLIEVSAR